jgi:hypothetical protein
MARIVTASAPPTPATPVRLPRPPEDAEEHGDAGLCEDPNEFFPLPGSYEERDTVDAKRQLAVAKSLFDRGRMPTAGQAILEGVAWKIPYKKLAWELHLTVDTVKSRLKEMRQVFGEEIEQLGMRSE